MKCKEQQHEINCAMGNINDTVKNLQYWYRTDQDEDMRQTLGQLEIAIGRLRTAVEWEIDSEDKCSWIVSDNNIGGGEENIRACKLEPTKIVNGLPFCTRHAKKQQLQHDNN